MYGKTKFPINLSVLHYYSGPSLNNGLYILEKQDGQRTTYQLISCHPDCCSDYFIIANNMDDVSVVGLHDNRILIQNNMADGTTARFDLTLEEFEAAQFCGTLQSFKQKEFLKNLQKLEAQAAHFCNIAASAMGIEISKVSVGYYMESFEHDTVLYFETAVEMLREQKDMIIADATQHKKHSQEYNEILEFIFNNKICDLPKEAIYNVKENEWEIRVPLLANISDQSADENCAGEIIPSSLYLGSYSTILDALVSNERFQSELIKKGLSVDRLEDAKEIDRIAKEFRVVAVIPEKKFKERLTVRKDFSSKVVLNPQIVPDDCKHGKFCSKSYCIHAQSKTRSCPFLRIVDKLAWLEDEIENGNLVFRK